MIDAARKDYCGIFCMLYVEPGLQSVERVSCRLISFTCVAEDDSQIVPAAS